MRGSIMHRPNHAVIESNIPSAVGSIDFKSGCTTKQKRELEDMTLWMEQQEDWEIESLCQEYANKQHRAGRHSYD